MEVAMLDPMPLIPTVQSPHNKKKYGKIYTEKLKQWGRAKRDHGPSRCVVLI